MPILSHLQHLNGGALGLVGRKAREHFALPVSLAELARRVGVVPKMLTMEELEPLYFDNQRWF
jgi:hypothetical protein